MKIWKRILTLTDDECFIIMIAMAVFAYGWVIGYVVGGGLS